MGQIFLARHLLQKAMVNSPLGGRLRPCIGFRVNPAATTSSAALAHDSRHCSLLIPTCWAAAGLRAGAEAMRLGQALSCWPPHRLGISDCSLYLRYSSIVFFKACCLALSSSPKNKWEYTFPVGRCYIKNSSGFAHVIGRMDILKNKNKDIDLS